MINFYCQRYKELGQKIALVLILSCVANSIVAVESTQLEHDEANHSTHHADSHDLITEFELPLLYSNESSPTTHSNSLQLSDYKGKVVYIDFWASWCAPCLISMPLLNDLRNKYKEAGFEVIAINLDEDSSLAMDFIEKVNVDYPIVSDIKGEVASQYHISGLPSAYIIDSNGKLRIIHQGFKKSDVHFLEAVISKFLNEIE